VESRIVHDTAAKHPCGHSVRNRCPVLSEIPKLESMMLDPAGQPIAVTRMTQKSAITR
jgi:hypothetical protein